MNTRITAAAQPIPLKAYALMVLICLLWAGSIPSIRLTETGLPPLAAAAGRTVAASLMLLAYAWILGLNLRLPSGYFGHGIVLGQLFGLTMLCLYLGMNYTDAARSSIFYSTKPVWVAVGAHFLLPNDRLTPTRVIGLALAIAGIYLALRTPLPPEFTRHWLGDGLEILAALTWSGVALQVKKLTHNPAITQYHTLAAMLVYSIPLQTAAAIWLEWGQPLSFTWGVILTFGYQSILAQFLDYLLFFWLISRYSVSRLSSLTFLVPLGGVMLSAVFLHNPAPPSLWLGLLLVIGGIFLVNRPEPGARAV
jgi:drug/metabolite transporter (DMT)-like permease